MFLDETVELTDTYAITKQFKTPVEFNMYIDSIVKNENIDYMEAIIRYCDQEGIDIESITPLITHKLKEKIRSEAEESNLMRPSGRLLFEEE